MRISARHILVWFSVLLLLGCSTTQPESATTPLRSIPAGTKINVSVTVPGITTPNALDAGEALGRGAGTGTAGGAGMGLASSLYLCGPFFFVCAPITTAAGAVGGAVVGSAHGASIALPEAKAAQLESIVKNYLQREDIRAKLHTEFDRQHAGRWATVDTPTDISITLGVELLDIEQVSNQQLAIRLTSNLIVRYGPESNDVTKRILLNAKTESRHIDYWIADGGANLALGLDEVFAENSEQVVAVLSGALGGR